MQMLIKMWGTLLIIVAVPVVTFRHKISEENASAGSDHCTGLWRDDTLIGKCFGLNSLSKYPELTDINVTRADECRSICCNLEKCVTWQFEITQKECKIGGRVRLGLEKGGIGAWCNPIKEKRWNGREVVSRENGICQWGAPLRTQCFGLGDERKSSDGQALDKFSCAKACCNDPTCLRWQQLPGHGCFYSHKKIKCKNAPSKLYTGKRKCIPGHCGGMEAQFFISTNISTPSSA